MSGLDLIARGRLAQQDLRTRRLSTLYALRSAIGRANFRRAPLAASSPAISAPNAAATLTAAGYTEYNPATAGALNANYGLYTFLGGSWTVAGPLSPLNLGVATTGTVHNGNLDSGTGPLLGCRLLFREHAALGMRVTDNVNLMATVDHSSHANLCDGPNDGITHAGLSLGVKF